MTHQTVTTRLLEASIQHESLKTELAESNKHLQNMIGAVAEFLDREENRDVDTVEEFLAAVKFMNARGMKFRGIEMQNWLEQQNPH